jgi:hypothetical protein
MDHYRKIRMSLIKAVISIVFIIVGVTQANIMLIVIGVLMFFVAFYKKEFTYDDEGVYIKYTTLFKGRSEYKFDEMSKIQASFAVDKSTIIVIRKGVRTFLKFDKEDVVKILEFARENNVRIEYVELKRKPMSV